MCMREHYVHAHIQLQLCALCKLIQPGEAFSQEATNLGTQSKFVQVKSTLLKKHFSCYNEVGDIRAYVFRIYIRTYICHLLHVILWSMHNDRPILYSIIDSLYRV